MKIKIEKDLGEVQKNGLKKILPGKPRIAVGLATCGIAAGGDRIFKALEDIIKNKGLDVELTKTGCIGYCKEEPLVNVTLPGKPLVILHRVSESDAERIINDVIKGKITKEKALCRIEKWDHIVGKEIQYGEDFEDIPKYEEIPYFKPQRKIVLRDAGLINPEDIEEYIAVGGYSALCKIFEKMAPDEVIEEVKKSGLRGRGGAGFPTGLKWSFTKKEKSDVKYVICNADEGDPGAYMNRNEMESDPHMLIEGITIGAYAIGATEGYIYVRAEYPLAIERLTRAIQQARDYGLLGEHIFGTDFSFDIHIVKGAGAFVCGEETALIASIEGNPGKPRPRPPFPAQKGLWGKPTNINNVETWCNIPVIIKNGGEWFSQIGAEKNTGTKVFSLVGKVEKVGLVEVPLGTPIKTIVYDIGAGGIKGRKIKAVQTGGPSGGCIPASLFDTSVDYESLAEVGSIMGSGGIVVMDENTCMVDTAKYFLDFTVDESCGKCVPCREGLRQMYIILERVTSGEGREEDIEKLEKMGKIINLTSLCALGQTAPNPTLSTIRYFRDEYIEHIKYKKCSAGVCEDIVYAPCQHICPLGQDAPSYLAYIAEGKFDKSLEVIMRTNPFPRILGRVCNHSCESHCRLGESSEAVSICALKRFVADTGNLPQITIREKKNKKVAIIGSGPAGLSAAYFLTLKGYNATIFESLPLLGGMLQVGIPEYRLPKDVLDEEIERIKNLGVTIKTNITVGKDITIPELFRQDFKAVFIAAGLHKGTSLHISEENAEGVIDGIEFLRAVATGDKIKLGKNIFIVGGGNVAMDVARTVRRLNQEAIVHIVYRRTRKEMPAIPEEVEEALAENSKIQFLTNPTRITTENGKVKTVKWTKMRLGEMDKSGRRHPIPIEGSEFVTPVDTLIVAIGQKPDLSFLEGVSELKMSKNAIVVDVDTLSTSVDGVFAGGDIITGPSTVVEAAAAGKTAAESIDRYLQGIPLQRKYEVHFPTENVPTLEFTSEELEELAVQERVEIEKLSISQRIGNFKEVEKTLTAEEAIKEARRCLRCDVREE